MNKELIKKYKTEFDYWLNGGDIIVTFINYGWVNSLSFNWGSNDLSCDIKHIVINDEYVEFRKALAEGKIVQEQDYFSKEWIDMKTNNFHDSSDTQYSGVYRIKPEEPQFKVGDWVTVSGPVVTFTDQISSINKDTYTLSKTNICYKTQATPWKPKPGEYIWDNHYGFCKVTTNYVTNEVATLFNCIDPFNKEALEFTVLLEDCQPFIGNLPDSLKDKR